MSMSTGKDVIVATTHHLIEPTLLGSTKVMTLALSCEVQPAKPSQPGPLLM